MARYTGPVCRLCRRENTKLYLKGTRCETSKCAFDRRGYAPGQHGQRRSKLSDYAVQLREKQKVKRSYGMLEKQFRLTFDKANRMQGITGTNLLILLETRLDNVVFRLGMAPSRSAARQLVTHGHFLLNGKKVNIPSLRVRQGDLITLRERSNNLDTIKGCIESGPSRTVPQWLEFDAEALRAQVKALPAREDVAEPITEHLIVELYSK
ncbi:30S ribosomal protein S4 [Chrysiogenes arsenatis]|uniref:30S ribosomal protein S4 n=1 Tax=Chrysiogenes arsenatis TaxID=309797 RepID=UPI0004844B48|nr:30S ribosomal protein S4 [Chrysiogenes arsenatis]